MGSGLMTTFLPYAPGVRVVRAGSQVMFDGNSSAG
jgi:hypothetical protein